MRLSRAAIIGLPVVCHAHSIFQRLSVDGQDEGLLIGLRAPGVNNPVQDVTSTDLTCGKVTLTDSTVISALAGSQLGAYWQHVIGGPQSPNDPDNPIASSHHGPITAWLAKVDNAATSSHQGLEWFKVAEDALDNESGIWGVDRMIANDGWYYFTLPDCVAAGQYLLRVELLALHSAYSSGGAQIYTSCAQLQITGTGDLVPGETQPFPGAYQQNDPSILINIYGPSGMPDNGGKAYQAPGMRPVTC